MIYTVYRAKMSISLSGSLIGAPSMCGNYYGKVDPGIAKNDYATQYNLNGDGVSPGLNFQPTTTDVYGRYSTGPQSTLDVSVAQNATNPLNYQRVVELEVGLRPAYGIYVSQNMVMQESAMVGNPAYACNQQQFPRMFAGGARDRQQDMYGCACKR